MIIVKRLDARQVLEALIYMFADSIPEDIKANNSEIAAAFGKDNSVEIYVIPKETGGN